MKEPTVTYRVPATNHEAVRDLLANGVEVIRSQAPHKTSLDWIECDVRSEAIEAIEKLGGERVTPR